MKLKSIIWSVLGFLAILALIGAVTDKHPSQSGAPTTSTSTSNVSTTTVPNSSKCSAIKTDVVAAMNDVKTVGNDLLNGDAQSLIVDSLISANSLTISIADFKRIGAPTQIATAFQEYKNAMLMVRHDLDTGSTPVMSDITPATTTALEKSTYDLSPLPQIVTTFCS